MLIISNGKCIVNIMNRVVNVAFGCEGCFMCNLLLRSDLFLSY